MLYIDGYIDLYNANIMNFCRDNGFVIKTEDLNEKLCGSIAYRGSIKGKVKIVLGKNDFEKFNDGDILVTTMTTPRFTSIMKKASGIITDEGGITCHAAIIARELKKPCLIDCKKATEVLEDDMEIELDAINGVVNIL